MCPPPDSDPLSEAGSGKNLVRLSRQTTATPNCQFQFQKRGQLFISAHNETLSIVACASTIQIVCPLESIAETQPQLHPALLRLLAMISQYFTPAGFCLFCSPGGNDKVIRSEERRVGKEC